MAKDSLCTKQHSRNLVTGVKEMTQYIKDTVSTSVNYKQQIKKIKFQSDLPGNIIHLSRQILKSNFLRDVSRKETT